MMSSFRPNSIEDEDQVMHILHRVATLCKSRGVEFNACYLQLTHACIPAPSRPNARRGGKCTVAQFIRFFPFTGDFGESEVNILVERYATKSGDVHFQAIHNDISQVMSTEPPPFPMSPLVLRPDHTEWSQANLHPLGKLRAKVVEKRMRMYEHFQDFDPLRKGFCTVGQVKSVLTILNLAKEINKADFERLAHSYMRDDGLFCYADFCRDVDMGFHQAGLEKNPLATVSMPDASTTQPARRNTISLTNDRRQRIALIEDQIRTRVRLRRMLIKPMFTDMDKVKKGFITRNQFARVMGNLGFQINEMEIGLLSGVYCNNGNHLDFNYNDFIKCVDPPDDEVQIAQQQANAPYQDYAPSQYHDGRGKVKSMPNAVSVYQ